MVDLGSTTDPVALVPGSVSTLADLVWQLRDYGDALVAAGDGLATINTDAGWSGEAADAFHEAYQAQPKRWRTGGDSFHETADALDRFASTLSWAQARAAEAIELYAKGEQETAQACSSYDTQVAQHQADADAAARSGAPQPLPVPAFSDPGEMTRASARELLESARDQLRGAGDTAKQTIATARDRAPEEPSRWDRAGAAITGAGTWLLHGAQDVGVAVVNGLASDGNAVIHNPGDTAAMLGGLLLMGVSGLGEGVGVGLDATGVGAVAGVPLNVVSAAGLAAGATLAGVGALSLAMHAGSDSRVEPLEARTEDSAPGSQGRSGTKTDRCKEHLTERDLDAARRELNGEVVARKSNGTPWDHVGEVRDAQRGLVNRIDQLRRKLGDSRLSDEARSAAQSELSEASRLLDRSRQFVPPE